MAQSKHTEGPWWLIHTYDIDQETLEKVNHRYGIQMSHAGGFILHEDANPKANACLIAAAPDLYEALEDLLCHAEYFGIAPHYKDMAKAALKKARGE
jgi:hypothetical protein